MPLMRVLLPLSTDVQCVHRHKVATCRIPAQSTSCHRRHTHQVNVEAATVDGNAIQRRQILNAITATAIGTILWDQRFSQPAKALPLAPLGGVQRVGGDKLTGLTADQVKVILKADLADRMYFVTGELTKEVFADDCLFVDPTNSVTGLSKYVKALGLLFDPDYSKVVLDDIRVTGPRTIEADWKLGGWLRTQYFPWQPKVDPFQGHTVYTLNDEGLIIKQDQTWSISGLEALRETFTPGSGPRRQLDF